MKKSNRISKEAREAMEFAYAMGLKAPKKEAVNETDPDLEFAYAMGLRHSLGSFRRQQEQAPEFKPAFGFSL